MAFSIFWTSSLLLVNVVVSLPSVLYMSTKGESLLMRHGTPHATASKNESCPLIRLRDGFVAIMASFED